MAIPTRYGDTATNTYTMPAQQAEDRPVSQLSEHLRVLHGHEKNLTDAVVRLCKMADRLVGPQPSPISAGAQNSAQNPVEPPLVTRLDHTGRELTSLIASVHDQISRLECL